KWLSISNHLCISYGLPPNLTAIILNIMMVSGSITVPVVNNGRYSATPLVAKQKYQLSQRLHKHNIKNKSIAVMSRTLRIATRKSMLAMWQAEHIKARLEQLHDNLTVELLPMSTRGDVILDTPLAKIGGKGLFVKELEVAMLEGKADLAVHSMKDLPVEFPPGLELFGICEREDPRDAFVSNHYARLDELPAGAVVGTCSLRRKCQLLAHYPHLIIRDLRGN